MENNKSTLIGTMRIYTKKRQMPQNFSLLLKMIFRK